MSSTTLPTPEQALTGRDTPMPIENKHFVSGNVIQAPFGDHLQQIVFGMGCFWGAEKKFWDIDGVYSTAVGYSAGYTPNPGYEEVCSGMTGHNEVVLVVFDPEQVSLETLLKVFWESHNPTQGMGQGNDRGTQYRSGIYTCDAQQQSISDASRDTYQTLLTNAGFGTITTEIQPLNQFYYAEEYHQQYLAQNPSGYCGLGGTGVTN